MACSDMGYVNPDYTIKFDVQKEVKTVFIDNIQFESGYNINPSRITVGSNPNPSQNDICADNITDGGWFECDQVLLGDYLSIYSTSGTA